MATFKKIEDIEAWVLASNICKEIYSSFISQTPNPKFKEVPGLGFWNLGLLTFKECNNSNPSSLINHLNFVNVQGIKFTKLLEPETITPKLKILNPKL